MSTISHINDDDFDNHVNNSNLPVLVDYWAEWCGPCKAIAPILDELAKDYEGKINIAKLNIDNNQNTPAKYGIRGIPTLMLFKNGNVIDGTGSDSFSADIAIKDGIITEIGQIDGEASEIIDAEGMTVSPGFVDIHTHLDAQIGWDPEMTPICWHGVTTALIGNCGLTFAPCKPEDVEVLAGMMETVEDIPKQAILSGLPWNWEHYGQYLDMLEELKPSLNVAGLVGHCAVRYYVMGDRSFDEQATDAEKQKMADIVEKAIEDGAVGFSTNRYEPHKAPDPFNSRNLCRMF